MSRFPSGHFHSPVIDPAEVRRRAQKLWPDVPRDLPGINFRADAQRSCIAGLVEVMREYQYPHDTPDGLRPIFVDPNPMFAGLDARMYFGLLATTRPRRVLEVGGGYSTLLAADVNRRLLASSVDLVCVEPYPPPFLDAHLDGLSRLISSAAQDVPIDDYLALESGDFLFIDSSHVSKPGSDVNYLLLEVLPRLRPGVMVHVHDVFLPAEYPPEWVLDEERSWNEQYLVHALLVDSTGFEVVFGSAFAALRFPELVEDVMGQPVTGSSFWMRRAMPRTSTR